MPTRSAIPRWVVIPSSGPTSTEDASSMAGLAAASGLRFPRALSPTLQATLGELAVPAVTMAVHGVRQGNVRYRMQRLHDGRGDMTPAATDGAPVLDRPGAHRHAAGDGNRQADGDAAENSGEADDTARPPLRGRTRSRDGMEQEEPDMNVQ